jgi:hypothetical protein
MPVIAATTPPPDYHFKVYTAGQKPRMTGLQLPGRTSWSRFWDRERQSTITVNRAETAGVTGAVTESVAATAV